MDGDCVIAIQVFPVNSFDGVVALRHSVLCQENSRIATVSELMGCGR